jgi:hypothetical protein
MNPIKKKLKKIIKKTLDGKQKQTVRDLFKEIPTAVVIDPDALPPYQIYKPDSYTDGPEGFISWCEDNVSIAIYPFGSTMAVWCPLKDLPDIPNPETGRSYKYLWEQQKEVARAGLRMVNGKFLYRLLVLCWPRGEGKSLFVCLIQLWKFFNWSRQQIVLGANSKEQITFVHFDIIKDIILNSPNLLASVGKKNILEKKIRITDDKGNDVSVIRAISSFSGIVSNITGYTFSEIFDMRNPKFFVQLDGSIRNIPNAIGVIDSTVSAKTHILYKLFESFVQRTSKTIYFDYRFSKEGNAHDYWNPNMSQAQLDDYRAKFPLGDFERYFLNVWSSSSQKIFTPEMLGAMAYLGIDNRPGNNVELMKAMGEKVHLEDAITSFAANGKTRAYDASFAEELQKIAHIDSRLMPLEKVYSLRDDSGNPKKASLDDLDKLGRTFDTKWAVLGSIDRADPLKVTNHGARTMFTCIAKGLPGSGSRPFIMDAGIVPNYIYVMLHLINIEDHSLESLKNVILECHHEYGGIDKLCGERWGIWDLVPWCEENDIPFETVFPTYEKQRGAFSELYLLASGCRFKCPPLGVMGSKEVDVFREEAGIFYHDSDKKWFGSPEKNDKDGIQDDSMFTVAWSIYGGRELNVNDFKERRRESYFGTMVLEKNALGKYS